ncbi:MAG: T9SS type A sorting domain-containing protein [Lewinellaceae bacterium]|nr:T9SS type A sorting domain-containing protein [Lewinellaceae bacterium]
MRLNEGGDTLWTKTHFADETAVWLAGPRIETTEDGQYLIAGIIRSPETGDDNGLLLKFNPEGEIIWQKDYGGAGKDGFFSYRKTPDGGYILGGFSRSLDPSGDFYLVKVDSEGEMEWETHLGGPGYQDGYSVDFTPDGGYVIAGRGGVPPFDIDIAAAKCDAFGNPLWSEIYGGPENNDASHDLVCLQDGTILLSGGMGNGSFQASENRDAFLIKLNQQGSVLWERIYDELYTFSHLSAPIELTDGSIVVTSIRYLIEDGDVYGGIHKYDSQGNPIWSRLYAGEDLTKNNYLYDIVSTADGGFLALGSTYDPNLSNRQEAWLLRLDSEGYTCDSVGCVEVVNALPPPPQEEALTVSPNPSTGLLTAQWQTAGLVELSVFTATGRQAWAYQGRSEGPMVIDLSHLPPGLYLLTLRTEGQLLSRKFMLSD